MRMSIAFPTNIPLFIVGKNDPNKTKARLYTYWCRGPVVRTILNVCELMRLRNRGVGRASAWCQEAVPVWEVVKSVVWAMFIVVVSGG